MSWKNLTSRIRVGHRIYGGFAIVLVILGGVSFVGYQGLASSRHGFEEYARITDNSVRMQRIERDVTGMRGDIVAFAGTGQPETRERVRALRENIAAELDTAARLTLDPERRARVEGLSGLLAGYAATFERLVSIMEERDALVRN